MKKKLVMPKHTGKKIDFDSALKVCYEAGAPISVEDFKEKLFAVFKSLGREKKRNKDGSHYTKCAQLPKYFGFISQPSKDESYSITPQGRSYYEAAEKGDRDKQIDLVINAIQNRTYGCGNEGVFTCNSKCEPLGILIRMMYDLNGISSSEYGYVLQNMHDERFDYQKAIDEIKKFRKRRKDPPIKPRSIAASVKDWKTVNYLEEVGLLQKKGDKVTLAKEIDKQYHDKLVNLPVTNNGTIVKMSVNEENVDASSVEQLFEYWLQMLPSSRTRKKITKPAAEHYALKLRVPFKKAGFKHIEPKNLFEIVDLESFLEVKQAIVESAVYEKENKDGYLSKALTYYGDFLAEHKGLILRKILGDVDRSVLESGLTYDTSLVRRFQSALLAKPFVILTGLSGSGKTKLAEAFVRWLCGKPGQANNWKLVSVGADWTNSEKLLGYPDALHEGKYIMPDTGVLQFLLEAKKDADEGKGVPYFLILDEMNLSHVERYFADFLSAMESVDGVVRLHDSKKIEDDSKVPREFALPRNLFVIGTMNVDETTYMFSPKVLDRAQVIEFRVDKNAMDKYLEGADNLDLNKLCDDDGKGKGASYASAFLAARKKDYPPVAEAKDALAEFFPILEKLGSEFGFRTASEFRRFVSIYVSAGGDPQDAVDFAIMQKLLPKLHGSKRKLSAPLKALWNLCQMDGTEKDMPSIEKEEEFDYGKECRYPVSAKKILRMVRALEVGFASFAEA